MHHQACVLSASTSQAPVFVNRSGSEDRLAWLSRVPAALPGAAWLVALENMVRLDSCASRRVSRSGDDFARGPDALPDSPEPRVATSGSALGVGSEMPRAWLAGSPLCTAHACCLPACQPAELDLPLNRCVQKLAGGQLGASRPYASPKPVCATLDLLHLQLRRAQGSLPVPRLLLVLVSQHLEVHEGAGQHCGAQLVSQAESSTGAAALMIAYLGTPGPVPQLCWCRRSAPR